MTNTEYLYTKIYTKSVSNTTVTFEVELVEKTKPNKLVVVHTPRKDVEKIVQLTNNNYDNFQIINDGLKTKLQDFKNLIQDNL